MNNKETFVEKLNSCGEVKYEMSEVHSRIIGKIKDVYEVVFKREKSDFLALRNNMYFKGGVKTPDSRPMLHEMLDKFINLVNHYDFLGDDELTGYLKEHGIELKVTQPQIQDGPIVVSKEDTKKFERSWEFSMAGEKAPATKKEVLNMILDRSLDVTKTIENKKEEIDKFCSDVEAECQVIKPYFMKAVGIKVKEIQKKSVDNEIVKIETDIESNRDIIEVFNVVVKEDAVEKDE
jgi:hypothetical protein